MLSTQKEIEDFASRWQKARVAALKSCVSPETDSLDERTLLSSLKTDACKEKASTAVFENSKKFGRSFARHYGVVLELSDIQSLLPKLGITCFGGDWHRRSHSVVRERTGCVEALKVGSFYCDYWREAADGLTMGVSEELFFVRHASCRHGDERCVDVWFDNNDESTRQSSKGCIPDWAGTHLNKLKERMQKEGVRINFEGVAEGVIFCQIISAKSPSCSDTVNWEEKISVELRSFWPGIRLKNTTPVAVYGEKL